jgi:hypothetical protein
LRADTEAGLAVSVETLTASTLVARSPGPGTPVRAWTCPTCRTGTSRTL